MDIRAHVQALNDKRQKAHNELMAHLDDVGGVSKSEEDKAKEARIQNEIDETEAAIRTFVAAEESERTGAELRDATERMFGTAATQQATEDLNGQFHNWLSTKGGPNEFVLTNTAEVVKARNAVRSGLSGGDIVRNSLLSDTGSVGTAVQTTVAAQIYEYMENSIAMFRAPTTKIVTGNGEPILFPTVDTHGIGTQVIAQGTAIGGTDPAFSGVTLDAYKFGQLVSVAPEAIADTSFDLTGFVARNVARALSRDIDEELVVGTGSGEPQGIMTAGWGSVATGGSLITADYDNLVDLVHGVADDYLVGGEAGWLMNRSTAGALRKLRDGAGGTEGSPLWQYSSEYGLVGGQPDSLLGFPAYTDPNVASQGSAAKAIWFGDFSSYYVRQVGNIAFERSDHYQFNTDLVTFRGKWRVDGDVIDTNAGIVLHQRT